MNDIVKKDESVLQSYTNEQISLVKNQIAQGANDEELKLFLYVAKKTGLDPFARQIYCIMRKQKTLDGNYVSKMTIQSSIDGFRAVAARNGLAGIEDVVYDAETASHPNKATVTVYKMVEGQRCPFTATARWNEYYPGEKQGMMWNKMPYLMLGKVCEALALRKAFPNDLSGIYTNDEMQQADNEAKAVATKNGNVVEVEPLAQVDKQAIQDKKAELLEKMSTAPTMEALQGIFIEIGAFCKEINDKAYAAKARSYAQIRKKELEDAVSFEKGMNGEESKL